jgi:hypothetical protein
VGNDCPESAWLSNWHHAQGPHMNILQREGEGGEATRGIPGRRGSLPTNPLSFLTLKGNIAWFLSNEIYLNFFSF